MTNPEIQDGRVVILRVSLFDITSLLIAILSTIKSRTY